jgi:hypothetical protein
MVMLPEPGVMEMANKGVTLILSSRKATSTKDAEPIGDAETAVTRSVLGQA